MNRDDAIQNLKRRADAIRAMGATSLFLFGSTVRNEAQSDSDIDVFVEYDSQSRFNALHLVGIKQYLERELGVGVDVTTRDSLHPMLREDIERSAIRVF